jgi:hypothetical protein
MTAAALHAARERLRHAHAPSASFKPAIRHRRAGAMLARAGCGVRAHVCVRWDLRALPSVLLFVCGALDRERATTIDTDDVRLLLSPAMPPKVGAYCQRAAGRRRLQSGSPRSPHRCTAQVGAQRARNVCVACLAEQRAHTCPDQHLLARRARHLRPPSCPPSHQSHARTSLHRSAAIVRTAAGASCDPPDASTA